MLVAEIIKELKAIRQDFNENKLTHEEVLKSLEVFSKHENLDYSIIYNAYFSSTPEIYF